jgi:ankyrin repeat protein
MYQFLPYQLLSQIERTALHYASRDDRKDIASLLLERGADIDAKDKVRTVFLTF